MGVLANIREQFPLYITLFGITALSVIFIYHKSEPKKGILKCFILILIVILSLIAVKLLNTDYLADFRKEIKSINNKVTDITIEKTLLVNQVVRLE